SPPRTLDGCCVTGTPPPFAQPTIRVRIARGIARLAAGRPGLNRTFTTLTRSDVMASAISIQRMLAPVLFLTALFLMMFAASPAGAASAAEIDQQVNQALADFRKI